MTHSSFYLAAALAIGALAAFLVLAMLREERRRRRAIWRRLDEACWPSRERAA